MADDVGAQLVEFRAGVVDRFADGGAVGVGGEERELNHQLRAGGVGQGDDLAEDGQEHVALGGSGGEFAGVDGLDLCGGAGGVVGHELDEQGFVGGEDVPE